MVATTRSDPDRFALMFTIGIFQKKCEKSCTKKKVFNHHTTYVKVHKYFDQSFFLFSFFT